MEREQAERLIKCVEDYTRTALGMAEALAGDCEATKSIGIVALCHNLEVAVHQAKTIKNRIITEGKGDAN